MSDSVCSIIAIACLDVCAGFCVDFTSLRALAFHSGFQPHSVSQAIHLRRIYATVLAVVVGSRTTTAMRVGREPLINGTAECLRGTSASSTSNAATQISLCRI
ncbi:hypothetical protein C8R45DRAFT_997499 [Mycena sanguinolenta]|nr:hypothetical protein C8R45DRAFT_997499 [Mycena sanguinolenta]